MVIDALPAAGAACTLCLLGAPRLATGQRVLSLSAKDSALLALVALAAPIRAERAAALLWPQATAQRADANLRQRLFRLRRESAHALVVHGGAALALDDGVDTDLDRRLAELAHDECAADGELLGDFDYADLPDFASWLGAERARWRERRGDALAAAAERCEKDGALVRALGYAQRLVDGDALAEHAHRRLMRLHYLRGDRAAAIAVFERFERRLKDELGTRPSAETIELLATIERGGASLPARRAVAPASLLRPPRLVGREREARALQQAWAAGRVFALDGEAGIGKSRLLAELAAGEPGVVMVKARPGDAGVGDALLARLLRALFAAHPAARQAARASELALLLPEFGDAAPLAGSARRVAQQRAFEAALGGAIEDGLRALVVDDLHFADDASIELLQASIDSDALAVLRWGLAQRPADASAASRRLQATLAEAQRLETVALAPLDEAQLHELITSLALPGVDAAVLAPALRRHSGGNPLFALETLREMVLHDDAADAGRLPQPSSVGALVQRRLAQLSAAALRLARVAALAGSDFDAELAAAVLEQHPLDIAEPWRELEAAQVMRDGAFAHDLVFEAARSGVPQPIAALLHERIARHLAARDAPSARLAAHWAGAGKWQAAGEAWAAAARQAQAASQRSHEVDAWQRAADAFDRAGARALAFQARRDSVPALIVVQGVAPARALAASLLEAAATDAERGAALIAQALGALMAADHATGIAAAAEAAALAARLGADELALEAACLRAVGLAQAGRAAEGLALIEPWRSRVEQGTSARLRGRFWADYAYALNAVRRLRDTAFALEQAIANAQALGDLAELATLTSNLATVRGNQGLIDEALALAQRALALQVELGATDGPEGGVVHTYVGLYCATLGRYREALDHLEQALQRFARDGQTLWTAVAANHKVQVLIDLGQFARARQALDYEAPSVSSVRARRATLAARLDRALGQPGAHDALLQAEATLTAGDDPHVRMHVALDRSLFDEPASALARFDEVARWAAGLELAGVALKARLRHAQALSGAGAHAEAAREMREVVARFDEVLPADLYLGEAWWVAAQVFDASGDGDQVLMALARGAAWVRRVALPQVPDEFRDSFLQRNPHNRALLAAADRRLASR